MATVNRILAVLSALLVISTAWAQGTTVAAPTNVHYELAPLQTPDCPVCSNQALTVSWTKRADVAKYKVVITIARYSPGQVETRTSTYYSTGASFCGVQFLTAPGGGSYFVSATVSAVAADGKVSAPVTATERAPTSRSPIYALVCYNNLGSANKRNWDNILSAPGLEARLQKIKNIWGTVGCTRPLGNFVIAPETVDKMWKWRTASDLEVMAQMQALKRTKDPRCM
eukprot:Colp12_sorted_trinity150504_noHs@2339